MTRFKKFMSAALVLMILGLLAALAGVALPANAAGPAVKDNGDHSVFIVPRTVKGNAEDAKQIKGNQIESIELVFHTAEAVGRGGLYLEILSHQPGKPTGPLMCGTKKDSNPTHPCGNAFTVKDADGKDVVKYGLNYDDYQYSAGLLEVDWNKMYGDWIYGRDAASLAAVGGSIFLIYAGANWLSKSDIKVLSFLAEKAIGLYKGKSVWIMVYPTYWVCKEMYGLYNEVQNSGIHAIDKNFDRSAPRALEGWYGREAAERDWLQTVYTQAFENAMHSVPIDEKAFDIDAEMARYQAILQGKKVDPGQTRDEQKQNPGALPAINTVPVKKDLSWATTAFRNYFVNYVQDEAEDDTAPRAIAPTN